MKMREDVEMSKRQEQGEQSAPRWVAALFILYRSNKTAAAVGGRQAVGTCDKSASVAKDRTIPV